MKRYTGLLLVTVAILGVGTAAVAGNGVGGVFNLGQTNTVNSRTLLQGSTPSQQIYVLNTSATRTSSAILGVSNAGIAVFGQTQSNIGVRANATGTSGANYGVYSTTGSPQGFAGHFRNNAPGDVGGTAVVALSAGASLSDITNRYGSPAGAFIGYNGVMGMTSPDSGNGFGVIGHTNALSGTGVRAESRSQTGTNYGVWASAASPNGLAGFFKNTQGAGMRGVGKGATGSEFQQEEGRNYGGQFIGQGGISAIALGDGLGIYVKAGPRTDGLAIYSEGGASVNGNLFVSGRITKGSGTFKIDHPVDPANKYLSHSFVESPDMMNIYNGNVTTDAAGEAIVELPGYFEALNRDPRYQLTVIGTMAQAIVDRKIAGNRFSIRTSEPNVEVSWQVTGIRQDGFAKAHPVIVEEEKAIADRGQYLHPTELGMPESLRIGDAVRQVASSAR